MNISREYKCIFFHVPKAAGSSVARVPFLNYNWKRGHHPPARVARWRVLPSTWRNYFKFTFVRNPWDRFVSLYFYYRNMGPGHRWYCGGNVTIAHEIQQLSGFRDFCLHYESLECRNNFHFYPQWTWIGTSPERMLVDFVGRVESLCEDFDYICQRLGAPAVRLPRENASQHDDYRAYYDEDTIEIVRRLYSADTKAFGYSFDSFDNSSLPQMQSILSPSGTRG